MPGFSLPSHWWDLSVTFPSASVRFDQFCRENASLHFPVWEEAHPRSTLTLRARRCTNVNLPSTAPTLHLCRGSAAHLSSALCEEGGGHPTASCLNLLMGVVLCQTQALRLGVSAHGRRCHERCLYILIASGRQKL